jgi:hypothetical protein
MSHKKLINLTIDLSDCDCQREKLKWIGVLKSINSNQDEMIRGLMELNELLVRDRE